MKASAVQVHSGGASYGDPDGHRCPIPRAYDRAVTPGPTGAVHHIALNCSGFDAMIARLDAAGMGRQVNDLRSIGLRQIFIHDPNDIVLELNFWEA